LLEVDVPEMREKRITNLMEDVRVTLREEKVNIAGLQREAGGVVVTVAEGAQYDAAFNALRTKSQQGVGPTGQPDRVAAKLGGGRIRFPFTDAALASMGATAVDQSIEVVRRRLDSSGTKEIAITRQGA